MACQRAGRSFTLGVSLVKGLSARHAGLSLTLGVSLVQGLSARRSYSWQGVTSM